MNTRQLKEVIREMIRAELDDTNEGFMDKLPGRMNPATVQAHQQGLHSIGFGRWANSQGHYVAKTVDGKLQSIDSAGRRTQPKDRNPKTMPLNRGIEQGGSHTMADPYDARERIQMVARTKLQTAFKSSPAVQRAAKTGANLSGAQMTALTGVPEKAFRVVSHNVTPDGVRSIAIDRRTALDYNPQTQMYKFRREPDTI
jgi:hypothetical protein